MAFKTLKISPTKEQPFLVPGGCHFFPWLSKKFSNFSGILILITTIFLSCSKAKTPEYVKIENGQELIPSSIWKEYLVDTDSITINFGESTKAKMDSMLFGHQRISKDNLNIRILFLRDGQGKSIAEVLKTGLSSGHFLMDIPEPNVFERFQFEEVQKSPAEKSLPPNVKTFIGKSLDASSYASIVITPRGFNCRVFSPNGSYIVEEFIRDNKSYVVSYDKGIARDTLTPFREYPIMPKLNKASRLSTNSDASQPVKVFRIAISTTGEFTAFYGADEESTRWAIREAVEQVSAIYRRELGIVLDLILDDRFIFTNAATDPFTNYNADSVLHQNQRLLDGVLGDVNYDIGHVFTTDSSGGKASVGSAGISGIKAMGTSGIARPYGHKFIVDYLAHEIGHQLGANHIFNSCLPIDPAFRNGSTAYEPGSGSTIMSYAGICQSDDLQENSDEYFNTISYSEINAHMNSLSGIRTFNMNNRPPTLSIQSGSNVYIPKLTPFQLEANAVDPDFDSILYCWEQIDCDSANAIPVDRQTKTSPIFRSFPPSQKAFRTFPRLMDFLGGSKLLGELLPNQGRKLNFSVTARDMRGGVVYSDIILNVDDNSGPFIITYPKDYVKVLQNSTMSVKWNKAGTHIAPINCQKVRILISEDGGRSFKPITEDVDNDGEHKVTIAVNRTRRARLKIEAVDNVFFAASEVDFEVE